MPKPDAAAAISTTSFQHSSLTLILLSFFPIFHLLCTSWAGTVKIHVFTSNQETLFKCKYSCLDVHFIDLLALIVMANVCWAAFCAHSPQDMCCIIALRKLLHSYSHEHYSYTVIFLLNQAENTIRTEWCMPYGYISHIIYCMCSHELYRSHFRVLVFATKQTFQAKLLKRFQKGEEGRTMFVP